MSLYRYHVFLEVAERQSFARAAGTLHLTPSAVSHMIAGLEEEFGFPLFVRGRKDTTLTDGGRSVLMYVKDILATNEMLELRVSQLRGATAGTVRVGVIESIAVNWLPKILPSYREQHPDVKVTVQQSGYREMINGVQSQKLDLAVVSHTATRDAEAPLQFIPLVQDRIVCVSREPLPGTTKRFIPVEALRGQKVVLLYGGDEMDVEAYLRQQDVSVEVTASAHANTALTALVECGLGCGITTELALSGADRAGLTVLPLVPLCFRDLGIITRDPKFLSEAAKQMLQAFTDYAQ